MIDLLLKIPPMLLNIPNPFDLHFENEGTNEKKLPKIIIQTAKGEVTELDLPFGSLTELSSEIDQLTQLTSLSLSLRDTELNALPPEIGLLTQLTSLDLGSNQLMALPLEIGLLTQLTSLKLWNNQLTALPPEIGQLTQLTSLDLRENKLTTLPKEIGQLTQLTSLNLNNNQLTALPPEIGRLTRLTELNLRGNKLTILPKEIGQLDLLTSLNISYNPLTPPLKIVKQGTEAILAYFQVQLQDREKWLSKLTPDLETQDEQLNEFFEKQFGEDKSDEDDNPIIKFVNKMLFDAIKIGASDLHFEPYEKFYRVRFRVDGILKVVSSPPISLSRKIAARIKVMSRLDVSERRVPQDGRIKLKLSYQKTKRLIFGLALAPLYGVKKLSCEDFIRQLCNLTLINLVLKKNKSAFILKHLQILAV